MAQTNDKRIADFGMELSTELQLSTLSGGTGGGQRAGEYNYVNLLRLGVSLPISSSIRVEAVSISTCMTATESIGDDLQSFSNLDAGNIPFALSTCNVAISTNGGHSLFLGIRNMNEDYFCGEVSSLFTNSSCGIYPTISANYNIANYPNASVGMHYCYDGNPIKIQASLYNGAGYNRFTGHDNVFRFCPKSDGVFGIAEVSYSPGNSSYFLGNALYCKDRISATPWLFTEQCITSNLTVLPGCAHSFTTDAVCKDFVGCGVLYKLRKYKFGAFTDYANYMERNEFATELTCKIPIFTYWDIQPTAHLITYDGRLQCVATLRMALSF